MNIETRDNGHRRRDHKCPQRWQEDREILFLIILLSPFVPVIVMLLLLRLPLWLWLAQAAILYIGGALAFVYYIKHETGAHLKAWFTAFTIWLVGIILYWIGTIMLIVYFVVRGRR